MADDDDDLPGDLDIDADSIARTEVEGQRDALKSENDALQVRIQALEAEVGPRSNRGR